MKPHDENGKKAPEDRPFRVLLIAGSNRRQYDCSSVDSKARTLMFRMADRLQEDWDTLARSDAQIRRAGRVGCDVSKPSD